MAKPDLGTKHECTSCEAKFYDMGKPSPVCPRCGTDQNEHAANLAKAQAKAEAAVLADIEEDEDDLDDLTPDDDDDGAEDDDLLDEEDEEDEGLDDDDLDDEDEDDDL